jgi:hypothetical protein
MITRLSRTRGKYYVIIYGLMNIAAAVNEDTMTLTFEAFLKTIEIEEWIWR